MKRLFLFLSILFLFSTTVFATPAVTLTNTVVQGQNAPNQSFHVQNSGGGALAYSIVCGDTWVSLGTTFGGSTAEKNLVILKYNTATLAVGTYTSTITLADPNANNSPQTVVVNLTVTAAPAASVFGVTP